MSQDRPFRTTSNGNDPSRPMADERPTGTVTYKQESLIFSQLLAAVALLVVLPYLVLFFERIDTVGYWCAVLVMLYGLWRGFLVWQYSNALRQYKLAERDATAAAPVMPKLFWNYDHFVFPAVVVFLLIFGYFQFGRDKLPSALQESDSRTNYVSPPRPVPSAESSAQAAPATLASPMSGIGNQSSGVAAPTPSGREEARAEAPALRLPEQWHPAGAGATRSLRVEGEHIYGRTLLREEDARAGNSIVMDVKKRGGKYVGETTLHLVSRSGQGCTVRWPTELSEVTPDRIEGRSMIPPGSATLDWNTCSYSLPPEWKSFTWLPIR